MDAAHYLEASYYERWLWSVERRLRAKGTIASGEVEAMMARLTADESPPTATNRGLAATAIMELRQGHPRWALRFVRATCLVTASAYAACIRRGTPVARVTYAGRSVSSSASRALTSSDRATYGLPTEPEPVYAVAFASQELWGDERRAAGQCFSTCSTLPGAGMSDGHNHDPGGHHHERPVSSIELRVRALEALLVEKGLVSTDAIDAVIELYENDIGPQNGAKVVARAWVDPAYRGRLLSDGAAAIAELGYGGDEGSTMVVLPNGPGVHNAVVCTLCSCYPWPVLGLPPSWYKSAPYRARMVSSRAPCCASSASSAGRDHDPRLGLHRRGAVPRAPRAARRYRGLGRRGAGRDRHARCDDRRRAAGRRAGAGMSGRRPRRCRRRPGVDGAAAARQRRAGVRRGLAGPSSRPRRGRTRAHGRTMERIPRAPRGGDHCACTGARRVTGDRLLRRVARRSRALLAARGLV